MKKPAPKSRVVVVSVPDDAWDERLDFLEEGMKGQIIKSNIEYDPNSVIVKFNSDKIGYISIDRIHLRPA